MKILCVLNQNIQVVKSGGGQCALRNYEAIRGSVKNMDSVYTCIISKDYDRLICNETELYIPGLKNNFQSVIAALSGDKCCKHKYLKNIWEFIEKINPDIIYIDTSKLGKMTKRVKQKYKKKTICFFHNVEADYSYNLIKNRGWQYVLSYLASRKNERMATQYADVLICLTRRDSDRIYELYGRRPDVKIPITFKDIYNESKVKIDKNKGLLFVGSLFPPNYDGIKWFVDNVMIQLPDIKLTIVGKNFEIKKEQLEKDNVTVVGTVDNLSDYYYTYPVIVMPIQYGAGMKVKTAEALMYGKIIIATDEALEEYDIGETKGIHRCNTASEFVNAILSVFKDLDENETRSVFLKKYEFSVAQQKYGEIIMKIGNLSYDD